MSGALWGDLRYAVRSLRRSPAFALAVLATLALTIGANTAVFTLVRGVLLRPLPYEESDRLVSLYEEHPQGGVRLASYPTFLDWQRDADVFAGVAFVRGRGETMRGPDGPEQVLAGYVSPDFFRVLGRPPAVGRGFTAEDLDGVGGRVAVISQQLWRRRFEGHPSAVGGTMILAGEPVTIVGVMPSGFAYPDWADLWLPIGLLSSSERALLENRGLHVDSRVVARLAPGASLEQARTAMEAIATRLAAAFPDEQGGWTRLRLTPLLEETIGDAGTRLLVLQGTVLAVLLIGCANVINLSLSRAAGRARELGVRAALGASRRRIVRQLVVESAVLVLAGAAGGLLVAWWALEAFRGAATPGVLPRLEEVSLDGAVLAFVAGLCALATLAVGLVPAARVTRADLSAALAEGGRQASPGAGIGRFRGALLVCQIALAMMLLTGAGLLLRSFILLGDVPLGFRSDRLLTLRVMPPSPRYDDPGRAMALYERLRQAAAAVPGVESAALTNHVPVSGGSMSTPVVPEGWTSDGEDASALFRTVSPEYFATMGIPLVRGRPFDSTDLTAHSGALLVNQAFGRRFWPGADPVGKRVTAFKMVQSEDDFGQPLHGEVVGLVGDVRHFGPEAEPQPEVYFPYPRNPPRWIALVLRTRIDPATLAAPLRRAVLAVEPDLPVGGLRFRGGFTTVDEFLAEGRAPRTLQTALLAGFAATALVLAVVGLSGIVGYAVAQRRREIAVRVVLGADRRTILRLVLGRTLVLCGIGVACGTLGAALLSRLMAGLLFGVRATDPLTFAAVGALLTAVILFAGWVPASGATRVDPMLALRSE